MVIEKNVGHIAFQFEGQEEFFELGYKVLLKQQIENVIPCVHVQYNLKDRLLYDVEQCVSLEEIKDELNEKQALYIIYSLLCVIREVVSNGFIPLETIQVSTNLIFWKPQEERVRFIVLPTAREYRTGDYRNWNKQWMDTLQELVRHINEDKQKMIMKYVSQSGNLKDNVMQLIPLLMQGNDTNIQQSVAVQTQEQELQLIHNGRYGQFAFYIRKNEFVIGKQKDSVDGYLGVSDAVSRIHCKIVRRQNLFLVSDLGSSNHTYVNGFLVRAQEERALTNGDILRIANIDFTVRLAAI